MLFEPLTTTSIQLANRTVMAPMTRNRAVDANTPNALMALTQELSRLGLLYVHVLDHSAMDSYMGAPPVPAEFKSQLRAAFQGLFILAGGFDRTSAEDALKAGHADLIAFARSFLANPDLVERMRTNETLNAVDMATFYTPGPKGYTDYPSRAA
jgi:N-ethylmaleimide reductase